MRTITAIYSIEADLPKIAHVFAADIAGVNEALDAREGYLAAGRFVEVHALEGEDADHAIGLCERACDTLCGLPRGAVTPEYTAAHEKLWRFLAVAT